MKTFTPSDTLQEIQRTLAQAKQAKRQIAKAKRATSKRSRTDQNFDPYTFNTGNAEVDAMLRANADVIARAMKRDKYKQYYRYTERSKQLRDELEYAREQAVTEIKRRFETIGINYDEAKRILIKYNLPTNDLTIRFNLEGKLIVSWMQSLEDLHKRMLKTKRLYYVDGVYHDSKEMLCKHFGFDEELTNEELHHIFASINSTFRIF